jgi:hypothetical protein
MPLTSSSASTLTDSSTESGLGTKIASQFFSWTQVSNEIDQNQTIDTRAPLKLATGKKVVIYYLVLLKILPDQAIPLYF